MKGNFNQKISSMRFSRFRIYRMTSCIEESWVWFLPSKRLISRFYQPEARQWTATAVIGERVLFIQTVQEVIGYSSLEKASLDINCIIPIRIKNRSINTSVSSRTPKPLSECLDTIATKNTFELMKKGRPKNKLPGILCCHCPCHQHPRPYDMAFLLRKRYMQMQISLRIICEEHHWDMVRRSYMEVRKTSSSSIR